MAIVERLDIYTCYKTALWDIRKVAGLLGSKFFPVRIDPFQKGLVATKRKQNIIKVVSLLIMAENLRNIPIRLKWYFVCSVSCTITKTCLYNFDPLNPIFI